MTLSEDISTISTSLSDIKDAIILKGVTPSGNITTYATAIGQISSGEPQYINREIVNGVFQMPVTSFTFSLPRNVTDISYYALYYAFYNCTSLALIDLSSLTTVSGDYALYQAFYRCTSLTSVDLSSLTTVSGDYTLYSAFRNCTSLTSVDLSSLTTVSGENALSYAFYDCSNLRSIDLSSLTIISKNSLYGAFRNCTLLTSLSFPSLKSTSFGSYTNQFSTMLSGVTGCTVHFPSNLQNIIGSWTDVVSGFGGTNTTVLFDLPATTYG